jgi:psiF repeat
MHRYAFVAAVLIAILPGTPSFAVTAKQKMETCKFGADDQKLQGAARSTFLKKCMANRDDPRGPAPTSVSAHASGTSPPPKQ